MTPPPDGPYLQAIAQEMLDWIQSGPTHRGYTAGQASTPLYAADGTAKDWAYATFGNPSYAIELPPRNASPVTAQA